VEMWQKVTFSSFMKGIFVDSDAKRLFLYLLLLICFTVIEGVYGTWANSLGLLSDAFHTAFDCVGLLISLTAMVLSKHEPTLSFSYGYDRFEVLAAFANGIFLFCVSIFLFIESFERLLEPMEIHSHGRVVSVALIGLVVNVIGFVVFHEHHSHSRDLDVPVVGRRGRGRPMNVRAVVAHVMADILTCAGIAISTWLAQAGYPLADPLVSLLIAALILQQATPIVLHAGRLLLQTTPLTILHEIQQCIRETSAYDGVLECGNAHFWSMTPGVYVGSLLVRIRSDANEQMILQQVTDIFSRFITHLTIQIEKDDWNLASREQQ